MGQAELLVDGAPLLPGCLFRYPDVVGPCGHTFLLWAGKLQTCVNDVCVIRRVWSILVECSQVAE